MSSAWFPGRLIVLTVVALIFWVGISSQYSTYQQLFQYTNYSLAVYIPFNCIIIMLLINYSLVCNTDPGAVPINWVPPTQQPSFEVKRSNYEPRFCRTCNNYKPARSHHCSSCKRCVLKMDHHCPWINNCVGHANYGHFIRFLFYVNLANIYVLVLLCLSLADMVKNLHENPVNMVRAVIMGIDLFLDVPVTVAVGILSGYHVYCLTTNTTTIEGWERDQTVTVKYKDKIKKIKHPYNTGKVNNIKTILGQNPLLWFIPQQMIGDGLTFPINPKFSLVDEEKPIPNSCSHISTSTLHVPDEMHVGHEKHHSHPDPAGAAEPPTPASIRTFASSSTLVDHRAHDTTGETVELTSVKVY